MGVADRQTVSSVTNGGGNVREAIVDAVDILPRSPSPAQIPTHGPLTDQALDDEPLQTTSERSEGGMLFHEQGLEDKNHTERLSDSEKQRSSRTRRDFKRLWRSATNQDKRETAEELNDPLAATREIDARTPAVPYDNHPQRQRFGSTHVSEGSKIEARIEPTIERSRWSPNLKDTWLNTHITSGTIPRTTDFILPQGDQRMTIDEKVTTEMSRIPGFLSRRGTEMERYGLVPNTKQTQEEYPLEQMMALSGIDHLQGQIEKRLEEHEKSQKGSISTKKRFWLKQPASIAKPYSSNRAEAAVKSDIQSYFRAFHIDGEAAAARRKDLQVPAYPWQPELPPTATASNERYHEPGNPFGSHETVKYAYSLPAPTMLPTQSRVPSSGPAWYPSLARSARRDSMASLDSPPAPQPRAMRTSQCDYTTASGFLGSAYDSLNLLNHPGLSDLTALNRKRLWAGGAEAEGQAYSQGWIRELLPIRNELDLLLKSADLDMETRLEVGTATADLDQAMRLMERGSSRSVHREHTTSTDDIQTVFEWSETD